jgi:SAM-dependent methyltransferase
MSLDSYKYAGLDFNAPLSDARASELIAALQPLHGVQVKDFGCGWAELLLRILASEPTATGCGIDSDTALIERGRANASALDLGSRVQLTVGDATSPDCAAPADVAISIGASHAWGGTARALDAICARTKPGGRAIFVDGFWERSPSDEALVALGGDANEFKFLPQLVDLAIATGFRVLAVSVANTDEWDAFESRWCAGRERWLLDFPKDEKALEVREQVDQHRRAWLHGYRGYLGFAYLVLALPS